MRVSLQVEAQEFSVPGLDPIMAIWRNDGPGRGSVTLVCWGCAWTAYFNAMNGRTIQRFFDEADAGYLVTKLGINQVLKQRRRDMAYLGRIIAAVKAGRATEQAEESAEAQSAAYVRSLRESEIAELDGLGVLDA